MGITLIVSSQLFSKDEREQKILNEKLTDLITVMEKTNSEDLISQGSELEKINTVVVNKCIDFLKSNCKGFVLPTMVDSPFPTRDEENNHIKLAEQIINAINILRVYDTEAKSIPVLINYLATTKSASMRHPEEHWSWTIVMSRLTTTNQDNEVAKAILQYCADGKLDETFGIGEESSGLSVNWNRNASWVLHRLLGKEQESYCQAYYNKIENEDQKNRLKKFLPYCGIKIK